MTTYNKQYAKLPFSLRSPVVHIHQPLNNFCVIVFAEVCFVQPANICNTSVLL